MEVRLGNIFGFTGGNYAGNVYDQNFMCPTLNTMQGGCKQPMIIDDVLGGINYKVSEDFQKGILPGISRSILANNDGTACIVVMRGRNPDNPSDRTAGSPTEQRLEPNSQGLCNTLTSVQKDNLVMEKVVIDDTYANRQPRVYEDYSPALRSEREGLKTIETISTKGKQIEVASTILAGYERTNMTGFNADNGVLENSKQYRIRKLTPRECWRLMDFTDEDFEKAAQVNSNTQLYKQAGNSIVKNVLVAIIGQMLPGKENIYKEN